MNYQVNYPGSNMMNYAVSNAANYQMINSEDIDKENTIVTEQTPKEGVSVNKGSKIFVKY